MIDNPNLNKNREQETEESIDLLALFFRCIMYWPWFVASVLVCCIGTFLFLRYQAPVYTISSSVLIKDESKREGSSNDPMAAIQGLGMFSMTSKFDNEVEILSSRTLIRKVVCDLGLYIEMTEVRMFGYNTPLYKSSPVQVYMTPVEADALEETITLDMDYTREGKWRVRAWYLLHEAEEEVEQCFDSLPAVWPTPVGVIRFVPDNPVLALKESKGESEIRLVAYIHSPNRTAEKYGGKLSVKPSTKTTTIAKIDVRDSHKERGVDFIHCLVDFYNRDANDEKNEVAQKTAEFIEERIGIINQELGSTENLLADFKQRSNLTDLTSDAQLALQENSRYEQQRMENATQISLVRFLCDYINNQANADEVIPANVGLQDANLTSVIDQYNTMLIERKRLLHTSSESNPSVISLNTGIEAMRRNVRTTVNSVLSGLQITRAGIDRQSRKFGGRISEAPRQEKEFMTISRQQEIKATLYVMLLQKREENAITLASTANNGRIIEEPLSDNNPVSPKKEMALLAALVLGLGIPFFIVILHDLLKYKIENREDVEKITDIPVLGELPLAIGPESGAIVVHENKNDIMEEAFRALRTNLLFMLEKEERVILFSSSIPDEGKSFVTGNMAVSLALMGKRVIVVGMDIRKPGLNRVFNLSRRTGGITSYLSDPDHVELSDLIQNSNIIPNLDILPGGPVPPNPTELVARDVLETAMIRLKEQYDYILLDTAPIGLVSDTAIIGRVADICVYVCRGGVTPKGNFKYVNVLKEQRLFDKLAIVVNGVDMCKRKNNYGYGKMYGYGIGYGYGYGYGSHSKLQR